MLEEALMSHHTTPEDVDAFLAKHGFEYLDEADVNLNCPICRSPFVQPVMNPECGHVFCLACVELHTRLSPICPVDRQKLAFGDFRPAPRLIHAMVDELLVRCPHTKQGCLFTSQRHLLRAHLISDCLYGETLCPCSKDCSRLVMKKDLSAHVDACEYALIPCPMSCGAHVRRGDLEAHAESLCPNKQVECAHRCGRSGLVRAELDEHYAMVCPRAPVDCLHRRFGCTWRGNRRSLQDEHLLADCPFDPIKGYLEATDIVLQSTRKENEELKHRLARMEEKQERAMAELARLRASLGDFAPPPPLLPSLLPVEASGASSAGTCTASESARLPPRGLQPAMDGLETSLASLRSSLEGLEVRQEATFMHETVRLQEEVQGLRAAVHGVRLQTAWLLMEHERRAAVNGEIPSTGAEGAVPANDWRTRMAAMMGGSALYPGVMPFTTPANALPPLSPMSYMRRPSERQDVKL